ncbi:MAG: hypothetical protein OIF57_12290 [Marinobacterium sp.]|nr:hypothetical protein [Marinobacterium sp.]
MFEAHQFENRSFTLYSADNDAVEPSLAVVSSSAVSDAQSSSSRPSALLLPEPLHLIHSRTLSPLYIWFVEGKRKDRTGIARRTWWVQVEYRRADGSHGLHRLELPVCQAIDPTLWQHLTELELGDLCPLQTRAAPVGC